MGDTLATPNATLTYVFCVVASKRHPVLIPGLKGPAGLGPVRLLPVDGRADRTGRAGGRSVGLWLAVADAPTAGFGETAINDRLHDLDWIASAAVAHERVVESFGSAEGVLPLKLLSIFKTDHRALADVRHRRSSIEGLFGRVMGHDEWGIRLMRDREQKRRPSLKSAGAVSGARYVAAKKAQRAAEAGARKGSARAMEALYDRLAGDASEAVRRPADRLSERSGSLLLDAAFLVSRRRAKRFQSIVAHEARRLSALACHVTLSGPWPPYSFMEES